LSPQKRPSPKAAIELTQRSLADLCEIERYSVKRWGRKTADKYLDEISAGLDQLSENPEILRLEADSGLGLFFYRVKKHYLVCDFRDNIVIVLTDFHLE